MCVCVCVCVRVCVCASLRSSPLSPSLLLTGAACGVPDETTKGVRGLHGLGTHVGIPTGAVDALHIESPRKQTFLGR